MESIHIVLPHWPYAFDKSEYFHCPCMFVPPQSQPEKNKIPQLLLIFFITKLVIYTMHQVIIICRTVLIKCKIFICSKIKSRPNCMYVCACLYILVCTYEGLCVWLLFHIFCLMFMCVPVHVLGVDVHFHISFDDHIKIGLANKKYQAR